jgi:hypothetical protein
VRQASHARSLVLAVACGIGYACASGPSLQEYRDALRTAAGPIARDCGMVPLSTSRAAAASCAGLARVPGGVPELLSWDSDVSGGSALGARRSILRRPCPGASVRDAQEVPLIRCADEQGAVEQMELRR